MGEQTSRHSCEKTCLRLALWIGEGRIPRQPVLKTLSTLTRSLDQSWRCMMLTRDCFCYACKLTAVAIATAIDVACRLW